MNDDTPITLTLRLSYDQVGHIAAAVNQRLPSIDYEKRGLLNLALDKNPYAIEHRAALDAQRDALITIRDDILAAREQGRHHELTMTRAYRHWHHLVYALRWYPAVNPNIIPEVRELVEVILDAFKDALKKERE